MPKPEHDGHIVSVIIPTIGRESIARTREALERQTRPPDEMIEVVDKERRGVSWARNEGIRRAAGDLIAVTDDDCIPPPDWLERLIKAIDTYDAAVAGGTFDEPDPLLGAIRARRKWPNLEQVDETGIVGNGGNIMYRRAWLETLQREDGYIFHEGFKTLTGEDWELVWRLRKRNAIFVYVPNSVVHTKSVTPISFLQLQFTRGMRVALLYKMQRRSKSPLPFQESLIWDHSGLTKAKNWLKAFLLKALGPFGMRGFKEKKHFWLFWLGEKLQSVGFLWGLLKTFTHPRSLQ
ncbi:MAG: glycosyltransferase family 2 protein [Bacteroidota bacterium]